MELAEMKEILAYGCKVLAFEGQKDVVWGHVSLRLPEGNLFLMKPATLGLEEVTADDIITANLDGQKVAGERKIHSEVPIHSEILRARPDVNCVVHTHPVHAIAFSALDLPLLPVSHEGSLFCDGLPVYTDTTDLIREKERGQGLARCLGDKNAVLMRNHGVITVGRSVGEAVLTAIVLEKACQTQLLAVQLGGPKYWTTPEEARIKKTKIYGKPGDGKLDMAFQYYVRQIKTLESKGYAF